MSVTDRRQTVGQGTANSEREREREFTRSLKSANFFTKHML